MADISDNILDFPKAKNKFNQNDVLAVEVLKQFERILFAESGTVQSIIYCYK